jgi:hypothetical protein
MKVSKILIASTVEMLISSATQGLMASRFGSVEVLRQASGPSIELFSYAWWKVQVPEF